jgi:hypothetical protein
MRGNLIFDDGMAEPIDSGQGNDLAFEFTNPMTLQNPKHKHSHIRTNSVVTSDEPTAFASKLSAHVDGSGVGGLRQWHSATSGSTVTVRKHGSPHHRAGEVMEAAGQCGS